MPVRRCAFCPSNSGQTQVGLSVTSPVRSSKQGLCFRKPGLGGATVGFLRYLTTVICNKVWTGSSAAHRKLMARVSLSGPLFWWGLFL